MAHAAFVFGQSSFGAGMHYCNRFVACGGTHWAHDCWLFTAVPECFAFVSASYLSAAIVVPDQRLHIVMFVSFFVVVLFLCLFLFF